MEIEVFGFPNCHDCAKVRAYLDKKGVGYSEYILKRPTEQNVKENLKKFQSRYSQVRDRVGRDNLGIIMPIVFLIEDSEIVNVIQGEGAKTSLEKCL